MRIHQRRTLALLLVAARRAERQTELTIPQASRSIDAVIAVTDAGPGWGILEDLVYDRQVILEHYGKSLTPVDYFNARAKTAWAAEAWMDGRRPHGQRPPLLLLFTGCRPATVLARFPELRPGRIDGVWREPHSCAEVVLVNIKGLAQVPGTAILRLTRTPTCQQVGHALYGELHADLTVPTLVKDRIMEFVMSTHPDSDAFPEQKWNTALWDRIFESGQVALVEELKPALLQWLETRPPASDANPGDSEDEVLATRIRELLAKRQC